jgi:cytochrome c-type biogenesis protein CcmH
MRNILTIIFFILFAFPALAITHPSERLADPAQEARAVTLTQKLRCVVCQNESIEASHADIARDLRALVRTQISQGQSDDAILNFLRARYGDYIMLEPPMNTRTYLLWLAPVLIFAAGALMAVPSLKRRRRKS